VPPSTSIDSSADVLVLCPQERDVRAIEAAGLDHRVRYAGRDLDAGAAVDPRRFLDSLADVPADGVVGTKDRSALLAALLAERRGLPGPSPQALLACQHKPTSRQIQRSVVPEATPAFAPLDVASPAFPPPFFVKPVVGRLSQGALRVDSLEELDRLPVNRYGSAYAEIAELAGLERRATEGFLAEDLLHGEEVTLEGYVHGGRVTVIGITDSVKYPDRSSFECFEYPTRQPAERREELASLAHRLLPALGFDGGFFNMEAFVPRHGPVQIVEVNGRIASQFAPLVEALHGRSTYDALLVLACGRDPGWDEPEPDGVAISYCVRVFEDSFVAAVPEPEDGLELLVRPGLWLSEQGTNDVSSYRLAIFTEVGETREEALGRCRARASALRFELVPPPLARVPARPRAHT
jgi:biotin carboxylase